MPEVNEVTEQTELDMYKEKAKLMGIKFNSNIGLEKLKEKVDGILNDEDVPGDSEPTKEKRVEKESIANRNIRLRKDANKLIRVNITCMNPNKKKWKGEIIEVSNSAIGSIKKFIPFNTEDGFHVPQVLLGVLRERKYLMFKDIKRNGKDVKQTMNVKEFAIEVLENLSVPELKDLAHKQATQKDE